MKKKYLETLQMNISNSYSEKRKQTCIFRQHNCSKQPYSFVSFGIL